VLGYPLYRSALQFSLPGPGVNILVGRSGAFASALGVDENERVAVYTSLDDDACKLSSIVSVSV